MSGPHNGTETECRKKRKSSGNHEISESDKKRSFSSKEKHEQSPRFITKLKTNKIHVNDDVTEPVPLKDQRKCSNKQSEWFDIEKNKNMGKDKDKDDGPNNIGNDNEGDEPMLPILEITEKSEKLSMLQTKVGNDKSFILDGGFLDENEAQTKKIKHEDEHEDESEKMETEEEAWQMDTSGNVSKKPVKSKPWRKKEEMVEIQKKEEIMRCDSSQEERKEFELPPQGCQLRRLEKSKRKEKMTKVEEGKSPRDSKDAIYKLPSNLMKTSSKELGDIDIEIRESSKRNSRGEVKDRVENIEKVPCAGDEGDNFVSRSKDFKLHFYHCTKEDFRQRDKCLQVQDSHKKLETTGEEGSPKLLKELKQLVRSKIRNNVKKKSSWSRKKKGRKSSQRHLSNLLLHTQDRDLKAFERRLTEVIASLQPSTLRWRMLLGSISVCTAIGAWHWLTDPNTSAVSFTQSLYNHPFFTLSSTILVILFMMGVHRRVIAPSIITQRARSVLGDFNMSCDDTGKLILKPTRPPHPHET